MRKVFGFLKLEPAITTATLSLLGALLGIYIKNPELVAALVGVAAAMLGVRSAVTPNAKVQTTVENVVKELDPKSVGVIGNVTAAGQAVIDRVLGRNNK